MKKIYMPVLLLGATSPAFGLSSSIGGGEIGGGVEIGGEFGEYSNACGCNWSGADFIPDGVESTCMTCNSHATGIACFAGEICDDRKAGNANGVIVESVSTLTVECGKWIPDGRPDDDGIIRAGYWNPAPYASCDTTNVYRCGAGYYGTAQSETLGCNKCPGYTSDMDGVRPNSSNNKYVVSSQDSRKSITDCYIMQYSVGSDITGNFIYTDGCFY